MEHVNQSQKHLDPHARRDLGVYEQEVLDGAVWLKGAGLNSAPNWYVHPHGSANAELAAVDSRFYTFGRTTGPRPESEPFGSPLRVKSLAVHTPTTPREARAAC